MTVDLLPEFEMYEEGSQIRRSSRSIRSNIVEGNGRRPYNQDFIRFLTYAHASCNQSIDHPETLQETGSLKDVSLFTQLQDQLNLLGRTLDLFIQSVELHLSGSEEGVQYTLQEETE
jgi:four helix bundle protein